MMRKIILAVEAAAVVGGMLLSQGCFYEEDHTYPAYGGYYDYPAYGYYGGGPTIVYRDSDEHPHRWWWQHEQREEREEHRAERREHHDHDRD
jgi:hypothetical protein